MPFYLLLFQLKNCDSVENLKFTLAGCPNGTPLSVAKLILSWKFNNQLCIYWLDDEFVSPERTEQVKAMEGVHDFQELSEITTTIYHPEWKYEDLFIENIFSNILKQNT